MDAPDLRFYIDYPNERHGTIRCYLGSNGLTHRFLASGAMPPFHDLLDFLRSITLQRLPAWFFWDEEGEGPYFEAWPLGKPDGDNPDFHLRIIHENHDFHLLGEEDDEDRQTLINSYNVLCVDATFNREAVVDIFLAALRDFVLYSQQPEMWEISLADLVAFEQLRARGVPPRCNVNHAAPMDLTITRQQYDEERHGTQYLEMRMWDMTVWRTNLDDTDAFWPQWFDLLEHALTGQPYEMSFINMALLRFSRKLAGSEKDVPMSSTRMVATPIDAARFQQPVVHFCFQIFEKDYRYNDFLRLDEVLDACQLARAFLKEFEDLLNTGYQPYPDEDGQFFDLRNLPLQRLKDRLAEFHP